MAKTPAETAHELAQECVARSPVLILGSGASAAYGIPGMPGLQDHLKEIARPDSWSGDEKSLWQKFLAQLEATDLETALTEVHLTNPLTRHVVEATWDFLVPYDRAVFIKAIEDRNLFPLTRLYKHLFQSTSSDIHVVTPNYDRIAEYAADVGGMCHFTGFSYGHLRHRTVDPVPRIYYGKSPARLINIWKVHGSFDWFRDRDGIVVSLPISESRPPALEPVIVTPGIEKYRITHGEPFLSVKTGADSALQSAGAYLCIGYGFNDSHVQTKLVERCRFDSVPLVVLTKSLSKAALEFLRSGKCRCYLALEEAGAGARMYSPDFPDGVEIKEKPFWRLDQFLTMVMA